MDHNIPHKFAKAQKHLYDQGSKAMFALISKIRNVSIPIDIQLKLFDSLILHIITYGCEVWGFEGCKLAEKLLLKFCKLMLNCKQSTATCMVLGELGHPPIISFVNNRIAIFG